MTNKHTENKVEISNKNSVQDMSNSFFVKTLFSWSQPIGLGLFIIAVALSLYILSVAFHHFYNYSSRSLY